MIAPDGPEIAPDELEHRVKALRRGPWADASRLAFDYLRPVSPVKKLFAGNWRVPMASVTPLLFNIDLRREPALSNVLRRHWLKKVDDDDEIDIRDSLDEALTHLQLMELAIEMGYVTLDAVHNEAREVFSELLWSQAARDFVEWYDYLSVAYLATRLDIDIGQGDIRPPEISPTSAVRFASVLASHTQLSRDAAVDEWLGFLDDYVLQGVQNEQRIVAEWFLAGRDNATVPLAESHRPRVERLARGAEQFVVRLSAIFDLLRGDERARVGLLYSYWLAKFFGYERETTGYRQVGTGWSAAVESVMVERDASGREIAQHGELVRARVLVLLRAWEDVLALVTTSRDQRAERTKDELPAWIELAGVSTADAEAALGSAIAHWQPEPERMAAAGMTALSASELAEKVLVPAVRAPDVAKYLLSAGWGRKGGSPGISVRVLLQNGRVLIPTIKSSTSAKPTKGRLMDQLLGKAK